MEEEEVPAVQGDAAPEAPLPEGVPWLGELGRLLKEFVIENKSLLKEWDEGAHVRELATLTANAVAGATFWTAAGQFAALLYGAPPALVPLALACAVGLPGVALSSPIRALMARSARTRGAVLFAAQLAPLAAQLVTFPAKLAPLALILHLTLVAAFGLAPAALYHWEGLMAEPVPRREGAALALALGGLLAGLLRWAFLSGDPVPFFIASNPYPWVCSALLGPGAGMAAAAFVGCGGAAPSGGRGEHAANTADDAWTLIGEGDDGDMVDEGLLQGLIGDSDADGDGAAGAGEGETGPESDAVAPRRLRRTVRLAWGFSTVIFLGLWLPASPAVLPAWCGLGPWWSLAPLAGWAAGICLEITAARGRWDTLTYIGAAWAAGAAGGAALGLLPGRAAAAGGAVLAAALPPALSHLAREVGGPGVVAPLCAALSLLFFFLLLALDFAVASEVGAGGARPAGGAGGWLGGAMRGADWLQLVLPPSIGLAAALLPDVAGGRGLPPRSAFQPRARDPPRGPALLAMAAGAAVLLASGAGQRRRAEQGGGYRALFPVQRERGYIRPPGDLVVMSLNARGGVEQGGLVNFAPVLRLVARHNPDIVVLQLAGRLGYRVAAGRPGARGGGGGCAVLAWGALRDAAAINLPGGWSAGGCALAATVDVAVEGTYNQPQTFKRLPLRVATALLRPLAPAAHRAQAAALAAAVNASLGSGGAGAPVAAVVVGDFNAVPSGEVYWALISPGGGLADSREEALGPWGLVRSAPPALAFHSESSGRAMGWDVGGAGGLDATTVYYTFHGEGPRV